MPGARKIVMGVGGVIVGLGLILDVLFFLLIYVSLCVVVNFLGGSDVVVIFFNSKLPFRLSIGGIVTGGLGLVFVFGLFWILLRLLLPGGGAGTLNVFLTLVVCSEFGGDET